MKKESLNLNFKTYINQDVKVFLKKKGDPPRRREPITGRVIRINKKFIVLRAKKANKLLRKIVYGVKSVKKEDIERINLI